MERTGIGFAAILLSIVASLCLIFSVTTSGSGKAENTSTENVKQPAVVQKPKVESKIFFDRIFLHETNHYSVFTVEEDKKVTVKSFRSYIPYGKITLFCDVEKGDRMWAEEWKNGNWVDATLDAAIHIHSLDDLNGAGWNHGKFGNGMTVPIE